MANKYDVRGQINNEKANGQLQALSSITNFASGALSLAETFYNEKEKNDEIARQQQETLDQQEADRYFDENITMKRYSIENEQAYNKVQVGTDANGEPIYELVAKDANTAFTDTNNWYLNYKENNASDFEGKSEAFINRFDERMASYYASNYAERDKARVTANEEAIYSNATNAANTIIDNSGTDPDYNLTTLKGFLGEDLASVHYALPELPDSTSEDYASAKLQYDFEVEKNVLYETLVRSKSYTPETAERLISDNLVNIAMKIEINSTSEEVLKEIQTNPNFDYVLYAQGKAEGFATSALIEKNGLGNKISTSDLETFKSEIESKAKEEVALFQQKVATKSSEVFTDLLGRLNDTENPVTSKSVYEAVDGICAELGIEGDNAREILVANMDENTQSLYNTYLCIGQENEYKLEAQEIATIINDDNLSIEYAKANNITYTSIEDLRAQIKNGQNAGVQKYLFTSKFSKDNKVILSSTDSSSSTTTTGTTSKTSTTSTTTESPTLVQSGQGRIDEFNESLGIQDQTDLIAQDEYKGYAGHYTSGQDSLDKYNLMLDSLGTIKDWVIGGDTEWNILVNSAINLDEGVANDELDRANEPTSEKHQAEHQAIANSNTVYLQASEMLKPIAKIAKELGIEDITQLTPEQIETLTNYVTSIRDNLAKSMTEDTEYFVSVGAMDKALTADEIKNESTQRILDSSYSNSSLASLRKAYEINSANTVISQGQSSLVASYGVLETLDVLKQAVDDGLYGSVETQDVLNTLLTDNPKIAQLVAEAFDVAKWADADIDYTDSADIQRVIDSITANIDLTASAMASASSKKTKYDSTDTKYTADQYKKSAKNSDKVKSISRTYSAAEGSLKDALDSYMKSAMFLRQDSINNYEITGEKDDTFEQYRELLSTDEHTATDSEVYSWMKKEQTRNEKDYPNIKPNEDARIKANVAIYKSKLKENVRDKYIALEGYSSELDVSNIIDQEAIDNKYKEAGLSGAGSYDQKVAELVKYYRRNVGDFDAAIITEKKVIAERYTTELAVAEGTYNDIYKAGKELAITWLKDNKEAVAKLTTSVQNSAWALLSMGKTEQEVSALIQNYFGVTAEQAQNFVANANTLAYDSASGMYKVDASVLNLAFNGENVGELVNNMLSDLIPSDMDSAGKAFISRKFGAMIMDVVRQESLKGKNANYGNALANFEAQMKRTTNTTLKEMFDVKSATGYGTADSLKGAKAKEADFSDCNWGIKYNNGELYMTSYTSMINNSYSSENNQKIFEIMSNDTTQTTEQRTKNCIALAINTLYGSDVITVEDVANMSSDDLWQEAINLAGNSYQLNVISQLGGILYTGSVGLDGLVKYATDAWWLDSEFSDVKIHYTDSGYVYECQNINGETVYAKPTFGSGNVETYTLYKDKNCTEVMYNPLGDSLTGMSAQELDALNIDVVLQGYRENESGETVLPEDLLHLDLEIREGDTAEQIEEKNKLVQTTVLYEDSTGTRKYGELGKVQAMNSAVGGIKIVDSSYTYQAPFSTKRALSANQQIIAQQKSYKSAPSGLTSIMIADGSFKLTGSKGYNKDSISTVDGQMYVTDSDNNKKYSIGSNGEMKPELTAQISNEKQKEYFDEAKEIVTRSGEQVSIQDAYEAVCMAKEGYDQCVTVLDANNRVYTYIPKIQQYIVAGWYL